MSDQGRDVAADQGRMAEGLVASVYDELRKLAADRLRNEPAGQTLQATALVHEAYLRLTRGDGAKVVWQGRSHFFAAAAVAMRRILVENFRRKRSELRGRNVDVAECELSDPATGPRDDLLLVDAALTKLEAAHPQAGELVRLRFYAGLTVDEVAEVAGLSERTAARLWTFARAWLFREMKTDFEKIQIPPEILAVPSPLDSH